MSLPIHFLDAGQDILAAGNSLLHFSRPLIVIKKEAEIPPAPFNHLLSNKSHSTVLNNRYVPVLFKSSLHAMLRNNRQLVLFHINL